MGVARINQFEAKPGRGPRLREFLNTVTGQIRGTAGCRSVHLLECVERPELLAVVEVWDSLEARQAAGKALTTAQLHEAMPLLAGLPTAASFRSVTEP